MAPVKRCHLIATSPEGPTVRYYYHFAGDAMAQVPRPGSLERLAIADVQKPWATRTRRKASCVFSRILPLPLLLSEPSQSARLLRMHVRGIATITIMAAAGLAPPSSVAWRSVQWLQQLPAIATTAVPVSGRW